MANQAPKPHQTDDPGRHTRTVHQEATGSASEADVAYPAGALPQLLSHPNIGGQGNREVRAAAVQRMQQTHGNRATRRFLQRLAEQSDTPASDTVHTASVQRARGGPAVLVQRHVANDAAARLEDPPKPASITAVSKYKKNSKKTSLTVWKRILESVKTAEGDWEGIKDHVMLGEDTTPPKGFHSKKKLGQANARPVGPKNPASPPDRSPYKQWTRNKGDATFAHLKISTFYPDGWDEEKITAAVLLRNAGEEHQVEATFDLVANEGTVYPNTGLENPTKPTA
ncbi:MAG TPA: hypothetical protein VGE45_10430 [Chloroflexia bacterium]